MNLLPFEIPILEQVNEAHIDAVRDGYRTFAAKPPRQPNSNVELTLQNSLVHHLLEGGRTAAVHRDRGAFDWYKQLANQPPADVIDSLGTATSLGVRMVLSPAFDNDDYYLEVNRDALQYSLAEPPCPLIWKSLFKHNASHREVFKQAVSLAGNAGFGDLLEMHAAIAMVCPVDAGGEGLTNWTVVSLPGTIYLTENDNPIFFAREIIHEAGHNWLNDAFEATGSIPDPDAFFFSPWKMCMRPAFGFLHACWAFPLTVLFCQQVLDVCDSITQKTLIDYLALHRQALAYVEDDFNIAVKLIKDEQVADTLHSVFFAALNP